MTESMLPQSEAFASFDAMLDFDLDDFQLEAIKALDERRGVLVCAPTGSGKTLVGEYAIHLALSGGSRCFYTTPIKALSNQKYHDLCARYTPARVGLLTGDQSINPEADVVVMTTEVLRNMIYADSEQLSNLSHVVMDEIHYLADRSRGSVWEEVILNLNQYTTLVGLSATVSNSEEFGGWLAAVRGDMAVIVSEKRPVPLDQYMMVGERLYPLLDMHAPALPDGTQPVNPRLKAAIARSRKEVARKTDNPALRWGDAREKNLAMRGEERKQMRAQRINVIQTLNHQGMLPAIFFIFSRAGCDDAMYESLRSKLVLTSKQEQKEIRRVVEAGVADIDPDDLAVLNFQAFRRAVERGFAAHHAGMLPAFRHIVEDLFAQGLIKVVYATETLALGINMPARTVILEKLVKYNGEAHVDLTPGEYTQLTGRAGRRGIDTLGNAVVVWNTSIDAEFLAGLASTRTYPLISTFTPGYNMAVNLINTIGFEPAHTLLEKSFAQYQADDQVVEEREGLERAEKLRASSRKDLETALKSAWETELSPEELSRRVDEFLEFIGLRLTLAHEEKEYARTRVELGRAATTHMLERLQVGDIIAFAGRKNKINTAIVTKQGRPGTDLLPSITTSEGWHGRIPESALKVPPVKIGHAALKKLKGVPPGRRRRIEMETLIKAKPTPPKKLRLPKPARNTRLLQLAAQIRKHPGYHYPERETLARMAETHLKAGRRVAYFEGQLAGTRETLARLFDRIVVLLGEYGYVDIPDDMVHGDRLNTDTAEEGHGPVITPQGEMLADIHSESDLLIAQCVRRGVFDELDPAELAGVLSLCSFESRRESTGRPQEISDRANQSISHLERIYQEIFYDQQRLRLPLTRMPEAGFALAIHQWTAGGPFHHCMQAAAASGLELTPGDFVRQARQVADLLDQVKKATPNPELADKAHLAVSAIRRGVVAVGG